MNYFLAQIVHSAAAWNEGMPVPMNVVLAEDTSPLPPLAGGIEIHLMNAVDQSSPSGVTALGSTTPATVPRRIEIFLPAIARAANDYHHQLQASGIVDPSLTFDTTLGYFLRFTLLHELGHALGLDHSDEVTSDSSWMMELSTLQGRMERIYGPNFPPVNVVYGENPSIMMERGVAWLYAMHQRWQRPIGWGDIRPTLRDFHGVRHLWEAGDHGASASHSGDEHNPPPQGAAGGAQGPHFPHWTALSTFLYFLTLGNYSPDVAR